MSWTGRAEATAEVAVCRADGEAQQAGAQLLYLEKDRLEGWARGCASEGPHPHLPDPRRRLLGASPTAGARLAHLPRGKFREASASPVRRREPGQGSAHSTHLDLNLGLHLYLDLGYIST